MLHLYMGVRQMKVDLSDLNGCVSQHQPQRHQVAAVHQVPDSKGVPKQMGPKAGYEGFLAQTLKGLLQCAVGQLANVGGDKQMVL